MVQEGALTALASVADSSQVYVKKLCCIVFLLLLEFSSCSDII